jgi:hypothetical protein
VPVILGTPGGLSAGFATGLAAVVVWWVTGFFGVVVEVWAAAVTLRVATRASEESLWVIVVSV